MNFTEQYSTTGALMLKFFQHCLQAPVQSIQRSTVIEIILKSENSHQSVLMITMCELELTDVRLTQFYFFLYK